MRASSPGPRPVAPPGAAPAPSCDTSSTQAATAPIAVLRDRMTMLGLVCQCQEEFYQRQVFGVPGPIGRDLGLHKFPRQVEISQQIEDLMAHELIGKPQLGVDDP